MGLGKFKGFQWDKGNDVKNWISHEVSKIETEQVFFNEPLLLYYDERHSLCEERYYVLGSTDDGRKVHEVLRTPTGPRYSGEGFFDT